MESCQRRKENDYVMFCEMYQLCKTCGFSNQIDPLLDSMVFSKIPKHAVQISNLPNLELKMCRYYYQ